MYTTTVKLLVVRSKAENETYQKQSPQNIGFCRGVR